MKVENAFIEFESDPTIHFYITCMVIGNLWNMSFMPLFQKYHDEGSPAKEPVEKVKSRASQENRKYYFIVEAGYQSTGARKLSFNMKNVVLYESVRNM